MMEKEVIINRSYVTVIMNTCRTEALRSKCIVGAEVTRSIIGSDVKISHQAFIGDANIDNSVIIGAELFSVTMTEAVKELLILEKAHVWIRCVNSARKNWVIRNYWC